MEPSTKNKNNETAVTAMRTTTTTTKIKIYYTLDSNNYQDTIPEDVTDVIISMDLDQSLFTKVFGDNHNTSSHKEITVYLPETTTITEIQNEAFKRCKMIQSIHSIPDSVIRIGIGTFKGCSNLRSIHLPQGLKKIDNHAFSSCRSLSKIEIPSNVERLGRYAFANCSDLRSIIIPNGVPIIEHGVFDSCSALTSITLPESLVEIKKFAFAYCYNLTKIDIPNKVEKIGESAFLCCTCLRSIVIPDGVTVIERSVFSYCSSLASVTLPESLIEIKLSGFSKCKNLSSIVLPEKLESIGNHAFEGCRNLGSLGNIVIPNNCKVEKYAFGGNTTIEPLLDLGKENIINANTNSEGHDTYDNESSQDDNTTGSNTFQNQNSKKENSNDGDENGGEEEESNSINSPSAGESNNSNGTNNDDETNQSNQSDYQTRTTSTTQQTKVFHDLMVGLSPSSETYGNQIKRSDVKKNDILSSRGVACSKNPGNVRFRELVFKYKPLYEGNTSDVYRRALAKDIVDELLPGRFIKMEMGAKYGIVLDYEKSIKKALFAMRDCKRPVKRIVKVDGRKRKLKSNEKKDKKLKRSSSQSNSSDAIIIANATFTETYDGMEDSSDDKSLSEIEISKSADVFADDESLQSIPDEGSHIVPKPQISDMCKPLKIKVGVDHQAIVPSFPFQSSNRRSSERESPPMVWKPQSITDEALKSYFEDATIILKDYMERNEIILTRSLPHDIHPGIVGGDNLQRPSSQYEYREFNIDDLLYLLHDHDYNTVSALQGLKKYPEEYLYIWTREDKELYNAGFQKHGSNLHFIGRHLAKSKNHKDVVDYHYRFKIPDQFKRYQDAKRDEAIRMVETAERLRLNEYLSSDGNQGTKRSHQWSITGGGPGEIGQVEKRRLECKDFLFEVQEAVGDDNYSEVLNLLQRLNAEVSSLAQVKDGFTSILRDYPKLLRKFEQYLPTSLRSA